jgi:hypothetical protein
LRSREVTPSTHRSQELSQIFIEQAATKVKALSFGISISKE